MARPERLIGGCATLSSLRSSICRPTPSASVRTLPCGQHSSKSRRSFKYEKGSFGPLFLFGAPAEIRTPDRPVRSQAVEALYVIDCMSNNECQVSNILSRTCEKSLLVLGYAIRYWTATLNLEFQVRGPGCN